MEHVVQFAISIDDKTIQKRLEENAYEDITERLYKEAKEKLPKQQGWGSYDEPDWNILVDRRIDRFLEENKDAIIEATAERLARSYRNSKAFKERMGEIG